MRELVRTAPSELPISLRRAGQAAGLSRPTMRYRGRERDDSALRERLKELAGQRWSMDFVQDAATGGRRVRCLTIVDDFTRERPHIEEAPAIGGERVSRVLDYLAWSRGLPEESAAMQRKQEIPTRDLAQ